MELTKHFYTLTLETQEKLASLTKGSLEHFERLNTEENRSVIFKVNGEPLILKKFTSKGRRDSDIGALLDLDGIKYFPKMYCYELLNYLVMDEVMGENLEELLRNKAINDNEMVLIREQYKEAVELAIDKGRYDWDFKLEHLIWDQEKSRLQLIDLGIYDPHVVRSNESRERDINDALEHFEEEVEILKMTSF
ncbi:hypothetical protein [Bacillus sp. Marseille-P3800]|uniref:hypothetical protein n=1 Tax=Bacillus sp. Marseille-P3800 TaxID=2014782 RepID=UPI000C08CDDB|nr:hypothetical protein [Bacillus sp. Marseille-P3800]